jgi:TonB-linked SusC/RagA family outer membrane protein
MRKVILTLLVAVAFMLNATAQNRTITGRVTDEKGTAVSGVSVTSSDRAGGTQTDGNGSYSIVVGPNTKTLTFSSVNFETQTQNIRGGQVNVKLMASSGVLDDVVVTGINRVKKSEFTGAVSKITERQIKNQPVGSFDQILQGRVPGLLALTGSGQPGNSATVIIRGQGSISGGSDPLYIIDGIPVEAGVFQGLNPNDFASVDVLRDASSTALYGSRGSAGIIVVTTKRGVAGKIKVSYSGQAGIKAKPEYAFRSMSTSELLKAQENYGKIVGASASTATLPGWYYSQANPRYTTLTAAQKATEAVSYDSISKINTNWSDEIFRTGTFTNNQISISGGTGRTRIYSSLAFYQEQGTTLRTDMKRITARNNLDYADDKYSISVSLNLGVTKRDFQQSSDFNTSNPFASSVLAVPYAVSRKADGTYATGTGTKYVAANQLDQTYYDQNYNNQVKGILGITTAYKITKNLTAALTTGADFRETQGTNYGSQLVYTRLSSSSITGKAGFQAESLDRLLTGTVRPTLTYRKTIREKHDFEVLALGEYVTERYKNFSVQGYGSDPKRPNTIAVIVPSNSVNQLYPVIGGAKAANSLLSGMAQARYTYAGKYTLQGSYRQDGSSKLPKVNRWQDFYSVGATWDAGKENFFKKSSVVNDLRIRLSYGSSGNSNNFPTSATFPFRSDYPYQAQYVQGSYSGINTIVATYPGNPDLKWETTFVTNLGVDFSLFKSRLYGDVNLYDKRTKDLFVQKSLSATAGFGTGFGLDINAGELQNKGVEATLNYEILRNKNLTWTIFGNAAYNKNKVLDLGGQNSYETGTEKITIGLPLGTQYEVKWAGVDAATGQPLYYNLAGNITNIYNASDKVQDYGTWEAPWKGGFGSRVSFKGFDLSVLFSWQSGGKKYDNLEYFVENPAFLSQGYNQSSSLNMWQKPGDLASVPSPLYAVNFSSKFIHDASFVRFKDITLAYSIPQDMLGKMKIVSNMRFYVQGSNLFIWTKWRGRDPEAGATNLNISEYPNPRAMTAGLDITF